MLWWKWVNSLLRTWQLSERKGKSLHCEGWVDQSVHLISLQWRAGEKNRRRERNRWALQRLLTFNTLPHQHLFSTPARDEEEMQRGRKQGFWKGKQATRGGIIRIVKERGRVSAVARVLFERFRDFEGAICTWWLLMNKSYPCRPPSNPLRGSPSPLRVWKL